MSGSVAELARQWFDLMWNQRRRELIDAMMAPDVAGFSGGQHVTGREAWKTQVFDQFTRAFPDMCLTPLTVMADGDEALIRWRFRGTHSGPGLGPPTFRAFEMYGFTWQRFRDGRIVEGRDGFDATGLAQALASGVSQADVAVAPGAEASDLLAGN